MMDTDTDVLVVGAGPTGLMMAFELQKAGVGTMLIDRLPRRSKLSRAGGVHPRTMEVFDQRGILGGLLATGPYPVYGGHFAGLPIDLTQSGSRFPGMFIPQTAVEAYLDDVLGESGIRVNWNHEVVALVATGDAVTATVNLGKTTRDISAKYLIAADGGRSTIRSLMGVDFPGRAGTNTSIIADAVLGGPNCPAANGQWRWSSSGKTWAAIFPLEDELVRLVLGSSVDPGRDQPVEAAEIRSILEEVVGAPLELRELRYATRITNAARQASAYRVNRVFLAGDAAHVHLPIGGQGMNTGIQDAVNLGWKLGAAIQGWGGNDLLDSYFVERHPVGARVLSLVQAQSELMDWTASGNPDIPELRKLFTELMQLPEVGRYLATRMSGVGIEYPMPGTTENPLVGRRAPDIDVVSDVGTQPLHALLHRARGVFVAPADAVNYRTLIADWGDRICAGAISAGSDAFLVRPDGYICWASSQSRRDDTAGLTDALLCWFGQPDRGASANSRQHSEHPN